MFVTDTAAGAVKLITPTTSLCKFLEVLDLLSKMFGIHLRGVPGKVQTIAEAVSSLTKIRSMLEQWIDKVQIRESNQNGKKNCNARSTRNNIHKEQTKFGNSGRFIVSSWWISGSKKSRFSQRLETGSDPNPRRREFFSKMRSRNDLPTVLEFAHLFAPTIRESLKQLTDTSFLYYTSPSSYYEAPETMQLAFRALPSVPCPSSVQMTKEDQQLMRDWTASTEIRGTVLFNPALW